jgi:spermidine/putrescine transport system ATP-binding protein
MGGVRPGDDGDPARGVRTSKRSTPITTKFARSDRERVDAPPGEFVPSAHRWREPPARGEDRLTTSANPETSPHYHEHVPDGVHATPHPDSLRHPGNVHADHDGPPDVDIVDVTKRFGDVVAVDAMRLTVARGSFYSFLGPSGCGKTTTLRMIAGFEQPTSGEIYLAGEAVAGVPPYRRNVNTVFQHYALFPHMNVAQNVGYGLRQRKASKGDEARRVGEALELVRLSGYERRRTWELSGGQQQRVALARALVNHPGVLLLDEPLGALDRKLRHEMQIELKQIQNEVGITFVYVTHDQEEALTMSDVIVVMRDGRIQQQGSPESLYRRPVNRFVAGFIGSSNFVPGRVSAPADAEGRVAVAAGGGVTLTGVLTDSTPADGDEVTVAIRPETVRLAAARVSDERGWTWLTGRVTSDTYLGDQHEYRVDVAGVGELIARSQAQGVDGPGQAFHRGSDVAVGWHDTAALVLTS